MYHSGYGPTNETLGRYIRELFGQSVLPHVSSVTLACARMGWNAHDTEIISLVTAPAHTRGHRAEEPIESHSGLAARLAREKILARSRRWPEPRTRTSLKAAIDES